MHFAHLIPTLFVASTVATTFIGFKDTTCQNYHQEYKLVTAKQLEDIVLQEFPTQPDDPEASRSPISIPQDICPPNSDDTSRFVSLAKIGSWV
jgi:hypothetical protein